MTRPAPVIGLVGGIGSGKSRVSEALERRGGCVVSGDLLGHEALRDPAIRARIVELWGAGVRDADGEIDRHALGRIVFADAAARAELEQLVHPWIAQAIRRQIDLARERPEVRFVILDAAIMLETGWASACDLIVYVHAPRAVRLERVQRTRGWTEAELTARERAQFSLSAKAARADVALNNTGSIEQLERDVDQLLRNLEGMRNRTAGN